MREDCRICERKCHANRLSGIKGVCGVVEPRVASEFLHYGEEPELVPSHTIFFSGCTFKCVFCQNWDISQFPESGMEMTAKEMATIIEKRSANNVNWVGGEPTPNIAFILDVLRNTEKNTPQVWNSNMYMSLETMKLLDGIVDLYLADFKYGNNTCAEKLSNAKKYWDIVTRNHVIANRQCEMIIRHLVLPGHVDCCSLPILKWISSNLDTKKIMVNVMDQYRPEYQAYKYQDLNRNLEMDEYERVVKYAKELELHITG
jgi:putative pyruvate formate lyase activating enzyme